MPDFCTVFTQSRDYSALVYGNHRRSYEQSSSSEIVGHTNTPILTYKTAFLKIVGLEKATRYMILQMGFVDTSPLVK